MAHGDAPHFPPHSLLTDLPSLRDVLRASLFQRRTFHSSGCSKCAEGVGHPQWVVNITYPGGKTKQVSISSSQVPIVRQWIANYHRIKDALEAMSEINIEAIRRNRAAARAAENEE